MVNKNSSMTVQYTANDTSSNDAANTYYPFTMYIDCTM